jgi:23S rRNA (adenine2030-N6)-methyltransferase
MNYRHAFHAGNHTEVFKHSILALLLTELRKKPRPFTVLDTHAGAGMYSLTSSEAQRTGEAQDGVARVYDKDLTAASAYLDIIKRLNPNGLTHYPGSPFIVQNFLREKDRLIACKLREDDAALLKKEFRDDRRISIHCRNGYEAISAFVPPAARRGLVLIDPPFEDRNEFEQLVSSLNSGIEKWPTGIFLAWYPIKDTSGPQFLTKRYQIHNPPTLRCQFLREPIDGTRLAGSGVILCNPPWRFDEKLSTLCEQLLSAFQAFGGSFNIDWLIREDAR